MTPWITLDKDTKIILISSISIPNFLEKSNNFIIVKNYGGNFFAFIINSELKECNSINEFKKKLVVENLYDDRYIYDKKFLILHHYIQNHDKLEEEIK